MAFQNEVLRGAITHNGRTYREGEKFTSNLEKIADNVKSTEIKAKAKAPKKEEKAD